MTDDPRKPAFPPAWPALASAVVLAVAVASIAVDPPQKARTVVEEVAAEAQQARGPATQGGAPSAPLQGGDRRASAPVQQQAAAGLACAPGRNGGATDVGVTGSTIKLGATVALSGVGASFLGDVRYAMEAVKNKVNRSGGICGRRLDLELVDDAWDFQKGGVFLRNLVEDRKVFALAVVPSSEGLKNVSDSGYLRRKKVPVVGSDGMLIHQYTDPYIWPVAASTISTMHIMAQQAWRQGKRHFAIVFEHTYHFGVEGAYAFNQAYRRLTQGATGTARDVPGYPAGSRRGLSTFRCAERFCAIDANDNDYSDDNQTIANACRGTAERPACDFVALLLEPTTALKWMKVSTMLPSIVSMGGPQPLFTRDFANACERKCQGLWLWTGYFPALPGYLERPAVSAYVRDVRVENPEADHTNAFVQGGYVGMSLLVKALQEVGPHLTRQRLAAVLDAMTFDSGLAARLTWRRGNHFANTQMRAFSLQYKSGFSGWRDEGVVLADPWIGQDIPS